MEGMPFVNQYAWRVNRDCMRLSQLARRSLRLAGWNLRFCRFAMNAWRYWLVLIFCWVFEDTFGFMVIFSLSIFGRNNSGLICRIFAGRDERSVCFSFVEVECVDAGMAFKVRC